eukprot:TRINITY_DN9023_c0_g1_i2.p1 TRINITY_DN9023_c0_g1~~TRINITY_DN9023_c0_g1_i2.p1  ORF type:complete len:187 (+),score=25.13 TRINITY_DN9023_c0_g1_i2:174-734(+)
MGSGASKAPETNDQRSAKQKKEDEEVFQEVCRQVFQKCDADQDGVLTYQEFRTMLDSKTLDLKLSETEIEILTSAADSDDDGYITYEEFLPVLRDLLQRVYRTKWEDWNDWTRVGKDANGKDVYLNKRTGKVTHDRPDNFKQDRVEEVCASRARSQTKAYKDNNFCGLIASVWKEPLACQAHCHSI